MVARLTDTAIETHNSSTNATLDDNPITFPLGQSLYVDATHEVVLLNGELLLFVSRSNRSERVTLNTIVLTALNLSTLASGGPLPGDHIPPGSSFRSSELLPFGSNVQFQCRSRILQLQSYLVHCMTAVRSTGVHI